MSSHHNTQDSIDSVDSGSYYSNSESDTDHSTTHLIPGPHGHSRGSGRGTDSDTLAASSAESLGYVSGDERRYPAHLNNDFVYPPLPDSPAPRSALPHRTSHLAPPPTSILKSPRSPRFPGSPGIPPSPSARRGPPPSAYLKNISVLPPPDSPFLNSPYLPPGSPYSPKSIALVLLLYPSILDGSGDKMSRGVSRERSSLPMAISSRNTRFPLPS